MIILKTYNKYLTKDTTTTTKTNTMICFVLKYAKTTIFKLFLVNQSHGISIYTLASTNIP
jgi:hypothetical protein